MSTFGTSGACHERRTVSQLIIDIIFTVHFMFRCSSFGPLVVHS